MGGAAFFSHFAFQEVATTDWEPWWKYRALVCSVQSSLSNSPLEANKNIKMEGFWSNWSLWSCVFNKSKIEQLASVASALQFLSLSQKIWSCKFGRKKIEKLKTTIQKLFSVSGKTWHLKSSVGLFLHEDLWKHVWSKHALCSHQITIWVNFEHLNINVAGTTEPS